MTKGQRDRLTYRGKEETGEGETKTVENGPDSSSYLPNPYVHAPLTLKLSWTRYGPFLKHTLVHTHMQTHTTDILEGFKYLIVMI